MADYVTLVESFEAAAESVRRLREDERVRAGQALAEEAAASLEGLDRDAVEKLMVWQTDKLYRVLNDVEMLDAASLVVLRALGVAFEARTKQHGLAIAYLVDNGIPEDRLRVLHAAFSSLRFFVASPELFAIRLGEADGVSSADALGARLPFYRLEAAMLAKRVLAKALTERRHAVWLSGACEADDLRAVARMLDGLPYIGVFRNDVPVDGTTVQIFRTSAMRDTSDELAFG